jgi:multiple sugar transport system ATP-binding protein
MIYVTHDQVEAMTMGDRICVMKDGRVMQVATPLELYNHPENLFVAGFMGSPPMNFFRGAVRLEGGSLRFVEDNPLGPLAVALDGPLGRKGADTVGRPVILGIRPEAIRDSAGADADAGRTAEARVEVSEPMGPETLLYLNTGATSFVARVGPMDRFEAGQTITVAFDLARAHLFDAATELAL